jgi:predicted transcriptional regulator
MEALDVLGNPTRRRLLELIQSTPQSVQALSAQVPEISRPAISRHLRLLEDAGLVRHHAQGRENIYQVEPAGFASVQHYLSRFWDDALPRFALVAENMAADGEGGG